MIAANPATIAVAPPDKAIAKAPIPVEINIKPAPKAIAATPNKAAAPDTINKVPITGLSKYAAPTRINIPALKATKDFAMPSHDIFRKRSHTNSKSY